ncbi:MAG: lipoprotein [Holophagaceae bacterium]|nr:lipoprotein [Holophagaceae bacterium]
MNLKLALASSVTVLALGIACGEKAPEAVPVTTTAAKAAPSWVDNPNIPDGLADVGIAQSNPMGDKAMQRATALADARAKLAGQMKVRVQNMFSQLNQQVTTASSNPGQKGGKPIKNDVMQRVIENVTRNVVDQEIQGATVREWWLDPTDGNLYCHLVMSKETMERVMQQQAQKEIRTEIAQGEKALENALDKLDAAIAASR